MSECPHPDCERQISRTEYACRTHWFTLPKAIRDKIWTGFKSSARLWVEADKEARAFWQGEKK